MRDESCANIYFGSESSENEEDTLKEKEREKQSEKRLCIKEIREIIYRKECIYNNFIFQIITINSKKLQIKYSIINIANKNININIRI